MFRCRGLKKLIVAILTQCNVSHIDIVVRQDSITKLTVTHYFKIKMKLTDSLTCTFYSFRILIPTFHNKGMVKFVWWWTNCCQAKPCCLKMCTTRRISRRTKNYATLTNISGVPCPYELHTLLCSVSMWVISDLTRFPESLVCFDQCWNALWR